MEGQCNCGAVRVTIADESLYDKPHGHICHCLNCRKTAGSALATNLAIEASKVTITGQDNLTVYEDSDSLSGNVVKRSFCKTCGNPIKSETDPATKAGKVILKLGIFERIPQPEFEGFAKNRLPWVQQQRGTTQYSSAVGGELLQEKE